MMLVTSINHVSVQQEDDPETKRVKEMASSQLEKAQKTGHTHKT